MGYYCHMCDKPVSSVSVTGQTYTCNICHGEYVEIIDDGGADINAFVQPRSASSDPFAAAPPRSSSSDGRGLFASVFDLFGIQSSGVSSMGSPVHSGGSSSSSSSSSSTSMTYRSGAPGSVYSFSIRSGGPGGMRIHSSSSGVSSSGVDFDPILASFMDAGLMGGIPPSGSRSGSGFSSGSAFAGSPEMMMQHMLAQMQAAHPMRHGGRGFNLGDYAFGRDLNEVINSLMHRSGPSGPPPASKTSLAALKTYRFGEGELSHLISASKTKSETKIDDDSAKVDRSSILERRDSDIEIVSPPSYESVMDTGVGGSSAASSHSDDDDGGVSALLSSSKMTSSMDSSSTKMGTPPTRTSEARDSDVPMIDLSGSPEISEYKCREPESKEEMEVANRDACPVCQEDFAKSEECHLLPCHHLYHVDCILPWLTEHCTCPVCRYEFPTDDPVYQSVQDARQRRQEQ